MLKVLSNNFGVAPRETTGTKSADSLEYSILKCFSPGEPAWSTAVAAVEPRSRLRSIWSDDILRLLRGKTVLDFGCGEGSEAIEMAQEGANHVIGLDIREDVLNIARQRAKAAGVGERCEFSTSASRPVDIVISIDAFEHFADPEATLQSMEGLLKPCGEVVICFGPTWYHPLGGHLFSVFPWAHLVFSEKALLRWRSDFRSDGATRFSEVAGGLNQITISRFKRIVRRSGFQFRSLDLIPIRALRPLHNVLTREFTTAAVRCTLVKRD
jgi:SAM-dependent methyltransferase